MHDVIDLLRIVAIVAIVGVTALLLDRKSVV